MSIPQENSLGASPSGNAAIAVATVVADETSARDTNAASTLERQLFLYLGAVALIFAFITGLKTLIDPDFFWQLATGRWVAQHHQVFSTDVFSYTAAGQPWIYPVGSALLFYGAYLLGGYALLSWLGAAACVGTVALLLRKGSAIRAGIAIVAVPLIAGRTNARAEMFTVVLFAAYLSLLWENYRTEPRAVVAPAGSHAGVGQSPPRLRVGSGVDCGLCGYGCSPDVAPTDARCSAPTA